MSVTSSTRFEVDVFGLNEQVISPSCNIRPLIVAWSDSMRLLQAYVLVFLNCFCLGLPKHMGLRRVIRQGPRHHWHTILDV
jgi:hypothetical protein